MASTPAAVTIVPASPYPLLVALFALCLAGYAAANGDEHVLTLDHNNFEEEVAKHDFVVVEFYAPWCGHCKQLAPEYESAAKALKEEGVPIVLAKVDADAKANKGLATKYGVQGFPTIKIFRNGDLLSPQEYKGPREADGIVSFLKKQAGPASTELKSTEEALKTLEAETVLVVGVFSDLSSPEFEKFKQVADSLRSEFVFVHTSDAALLPEAEGRPTVEGAATVRVLTTFDEGFFDTTEFETEALTEFIRASSLPLVVEFSQDPKDRPALSRVFESKTKKCLLFYDYNISNADEFKDAIKVVAKTRPEGITFIKGEASQNDQALKYFGIDAAETPAIVVHDAATNSKFYRTSIVPSTIKDFVDSILAGTEEKKVKSEPVPEKNNDAVKVAVGKNFQELVLDSDRNVLIEFYAPWCGHCKKLEPIYKQVANAFKDDSEVLVAKLDYTANDIPTEQFSVEGFPTIYLYTSDKTVVPYNGDRSKKDLISFVKKNKTSKSQEAAAEDAELAASTAEAAQKSAEGAKEEL